MNYIYTLLKIKHFSYCFFTNICTYDSTPRGTDSCSRCDAERIKMIENLHYYVIQVSAQKGCYQVALLIAVSTPITNHSGKSFSLIPHFVISLEKLGDTSGTLHRFPLCLIGKRYMSQFAVKAGRCPPGVYRTRSDGLTKKITQSVSE